MRDSIGVLALQGDVGDHLRVLTELGVRAAEVRVPVDLEGVEALILPGGESTAMSVLLEAAGLLEELRDRLADGMPAFGTCAGMILLATDILGGRPDQHQLGAIDLTVRRNAFGRQVDSFETELDVVGVEGGAVPAVFIRAPVVERVGEGVEVLAALPGPSGPGAARGDDVPVLCRSGPILVASFHPELGGDTRLHELFLRVAEEG